MQLRPEGRSRGQVIIVAALVIAAIFVGLALVLNSGIYAENLSSRETTDTEGALSFTLETDEAIAEAYERTNAAGEPTAADAAATFNGTVDSWEAAQQRRGAMQGIGVDVERTAHVGWRLAQDADGPFVPYDDPGTTDWTVVSETDRVGGFRMDVTRSSLFDADGSVDATSDEAFRLRAVDGSGNEWTMYIFQNGNSNSIVVYVGEPTGSDITDLLSDEESCERVTDRAVVDLRNGTVAGESCDRLVFAEGLSGPIQIRYENVRAATGGESRVNGTHELVVDGAGAVQTTGGDPDRFDVPGGETPTAQAVVYSASYASHYGRADLTFERRGTHAVREETYAS